MKCWCHKTSGGSREGQIDLSLTEGKILVPCGPCTPVLHLFLSSSLKTVFCQKPSPIAVSAVKLQRPYKWWEPITELHSVCKNTLNLFQFQYLFSYFFLVTCNHFHVDVNIYILFIAKRVVGYYGELIAVKIQ